MSSSQGHLGRNLQSKDTNCPQLSKPGGLFLFNNCLPNLKIRIYIYKKKLNCQLFWKTRALGPCHSVHSCAAIHKSRRAASYIHGSFSVFATGHAQLNWILIRYLSLQLALHEEAQGKSLGSICPLRCLLARNILQLQGDSHLREKPHF